MSRPPRESAALSLDELVALGDEVAALVRSGVPLERGLAGLGRDLPGRLGRLTAGLAERMKQGESLSQALAAERGAVPAPYHAVIEAGQAAGRLPAALESLSRTARRLSEVAEAIRVAMVYPLVVLLLSYVLAVGFVVFLAPFFQSAADAFHPGLSPWVRVLVVLGETAVWWGAVVPLLVATFLWTANSRRTALWDSGWRGWMWQRLPGVRELLRLSRMASFSEVLSLLVEAGTPLPKALGLAARATGDRTLEQAAQTAASAAERGESLDAALSHQRALPRFLVWLVGHGEKQGDLAGSFRHASAIYRERAMWQADLVRHWGAILLTLAIGGSAVVGFALLLYAPFTSILNQIAAP
jgi:type II secretory pathway component PulF